MKVIFNRKTLIFVIMALLTMAFFQVKVFATETTDTSFTLTKESANVSLNGSTFISYTGGTGVVEWKSSDDSVATVEHGTVRGHKIGKATITATRGEETATCEINVVYTLITIGGNSNDSISNVNLVLNEHPSENLYATVEDGNYEVVENAKVTWSSSDTNVVTVDENTGTITGVKAGKATITASATGVTDTCEVTVAKAPMFTDFSNAKYELIFDVNVNLKITGVTPSDDNSYHYIITSSNTKPTITKESWGALDTTTLENSDSLLVNSEENYMYDRNLDKYVELNQDMYLWIIEDVKLDASYALSEEDSYISYSSKFVAEGIKLKKPELPQLNLILQSFSIWGGENSANTEELTSINFRFPSAVENRKFKLKIGKVTDNKILQKIQNNDYSGITELLTYAKNNEAVYSADLTTTSIGYYRNEKALFDGISLLQDRAYYFVYAEFDDENGKYCPIEGVTLGQAWISSTNEFWDMYAYTADNFEWTNLSTTPTEPDDKDEPDDTVAPEKLPNAGTKTFVIISVITLVAVVCVICYKKYNWFRDIK